ncbi:MAG: hypothetical protein NUW23_02380 [Firmicutes bacterium]|nr:hypothetical protein [Bacillota bacterium]
MAASRDRDGDQIAAYLLQWPTQEIRRVVDGKELRVKVIEGCADFTSWQAAFAHVDHLQKDWPGLDYQIVPVTAAERRLMREVEIKRALNAAAYKRTDGYSKRLLRSIQRLGAARRGVALNT